MIASDDETPASVIICSRDRARLLADAVDSIWRGHRLPSEIVIIDQSATPHPSLHSASGPPGCPLRYFWQPVPGLSYARNCALATARHDILAFVDDDVLVSADWLDKLLRALRQFGPRCVVTGRVKPGEVELSGGFSPSLVDRDEPAFYSAPTTAHDVLITFNMAIHRRALLDVGAFDTRLGPGTRFPAAEDNDLAFRLLSAGYTIAYVPNAIVYHRAWRNEYLALRWNYGRGQGAFYAKHLARERKYALGRLRYDTRKYLLRAIHAVPTDRRRALGDTLFVMGLFSGASQWLLGRIVGR